MRFAVPRARCPARGPQWRRHTQGAGERDRAEQVAARRPMRRGRGLLSDAKAVRLQIRCAGRHRQAQAGAGRRTQARCAYAISCSRKHERSAVARLAARVAESSAQRVRHHASSERKTARWRQAPMERGRRCRSQRSMGRLRPAVRGVHVVWARAGRAAARTPRARTHICFTHRGAAAAAGVAAASAAMPDERRSAVFSIARLDVPCPERTLALKIKGMETGARKPEEPPRTRRGRGGRRP